jgi:hypothetical protein
MLGDAFNSGGAEIKQVWVNPPRRASVEGEVVFSLDWWPESVLISETMTAPSPLIFEDYTVHFCAVRLRDGAVVDETEHFAGDNPVDPRAAFTHRIWMSLEPASGFGFTADVYEYRPYIQWAEGHYAVSRDSVTIQFS